MPRARKPVAQKLLEGTYRVDRDGPTPESSEVSGVPQPPSWLDGEALELWGQIVPGLVARRVVGACDTTALVVLCETWARYRRFSRELDDDKTPTGRLPALNVLVGTAIDKLGALLAKFGLTPVDREKVRPQAGGPAKVPVAARKR